MPNPAKLRENVDGNKLDLSMSGLTDVPVKDIALIKKATNLDLSNNQLSVLPPSFCNLIHLVELDLSKNFLTELPDSFGSLTNLKRLDLYGNQLTHLPLSFCQLKALRWLDLKNNPLVPMLAEIAGPCGDMQQCQQCARNVVATLTQTAIKVEEDRKRLLEAKLREQELIEQEYLLKKKELFAENHNKKNKKKAKKGKTDKMSVDSNEHGKLPSSEKHSEESNVAKVIDSKQRKTQKKPERVTNGFLQFFLHFVFYVITAAVILIINCILFAAYDRKLFLQLTESWNYLPAEFFNFILYLAKHVEYAMKHPSLREMRSQLSACFRSIVASILNIYKTICQEFPIYYDVVKSKFV